MATGDCPSRAVSCAGICASAYGWSWRVSCGLVGLLEDVGFAQVEFAFDAPHDPVAGIGGHLTLERADSKRRGVAHPARVVEVGTVRDEPADELARFHEV